MLKGPQCEFMIHQPYTQAELVDSGTGFWQKQGKPLAAWLLRLWDTEVDSSLYVGDELERLASTTTHHLLGQSLQNTRLLMQDLAPDQTHTLMEWVNAAVHTARSNTTVELPDPGRNWRTHAALTQAVRQLGTKQLAFKPNTRGPDDERCCRQH